MLRRIREKITGKKDAALSPDELVTRVTKAERQLVYLETQVKLLERVND